MVRDIDCHPIPSTINVKSRQDIFHYLPEFQLAFHCTPTVFIKENQINKLIFLITVSLLRHTIVHNMYMLVVMNVEHGAIKTNRTIECYT